MLRPRPQPCLARPTVGMRAHCPQSTRTNCSCCRYAEYWWRDEWMSLDAHRDADEVLARTEKQLRYPDFGHVLYLGVGKQVRKRACTVCIRLGSCWTPHMQQANAHHGNDCANDE